MKNNVQQCKILLIHRVMNNKVKNIGIQLSVKLLYVAKPARHLVMQMPIFL